MDEDDLALIGRALRGDRYAFERLAGRHLDLARRVAYIHAPGPDVDDVVQESLIRAWTRLDRLRAGEGFRPWLVAIVANTARNSRRATARRATWEHRASPGHPMVGPEEAAVAASDIAAVLEAVTRLPPHEREAVAYRYFLDLSEAETAAALGLPAGTVKSRLSRGMGHLRTVLGAEHVRP